MMIVEILVMFSMVAVVIVMVVMTAVSKEIVAFSKDLSEKIKGVKIHVRMCMTITSALMMRKEGEMMSSSVWIEKGAEALPWISSSMIITIFSVTVFFRSEQIVLFPLFLVFQSGIRVRRKLSVCCSNKSLFFFSSFNHCIYVT